MQPTIRTTLLDTEAIHLALTTQEQSFTTRENVAAVMGAAVRVLEAREVMGDAVCAAPGVPAAKISRRALYMAAIDCGHCITDEKIILYRNSGEGNALSQLADRLNAVIEGEI